MNHRWYLLVAGVVVAGGFSPQAEAQRTRTNQPAQGGGEEPGPGGPGGPGRGGPGGPGGGGPGGPGGFFNDPKFRLRQLKTQVSQRPQAQQPGRGGFPFGGGMGGPGGGGGGMSGLLQRSPALQAELNLTEEQKTALAEIQKASDEKRRDTFRNAFPNNNRNGGGQGGPGGGGPGGGQGGPAGGAPGGGRGGRGGAPNAGSDAATNLTEKPQFAQLLARSASASVLTSFTLVSFAQQDQPQNPRGNRGPGGQGGNGGPGGGGPGGPGGGGPGGGRFQMDPAQMERIQGMMRAQQEEDQLAVQKVLTPAQLARLEQIRLQIVGPTVVAETSVAEKLGLQEEQYQQIQEIISEMDEQVAQLMQAGMEQMRTEFMRQNPPNAANQGGRNGGGAPAKAADPNADPEGDPAANAQAANQQRGAQNNQRFQAMAEFAAKQGEQQDLITTKAENAIAKVLTKRQKTMFNGLLGKEFDLKKLAEEQPGRGGPGGRRGPGGDQAAPAAAPAAKPAGEADPAAAAASEADSATPKAGGRQRPQPRVRGQAPSAE